MDTFMLSAVTIPLERMSFVGSMKTNNRVERSKHCLSTHVGSDMVELVA